MFVLLNEQGLLKFKLALYMGMRRVQKLQNVEIVLVQEDLLRLQTFIHLSLHLPNRFRFPRYLTKHHLHYTQLA